MQETKFLVVRIKMNKPEHEENGRNLSIVNL